MASRDRLAETEFSRKLLDEISDKLKNDPGLREMRNRRASDLTKAETSNMRSAQEIFQQLHQDDPHLLKFLHDGTVVPVVPDPEPKPPPPVPFDGKPHPTYFRHAKKPRERHVVKKVSAGSRATLKFTTDVVDGYFTRDSAPGTWTLESITVDRTEGGTPGTPMVSETTKMSLRSGSATLTVDLDGSRAGRTTPLPARSHRRDIVRAIRQGVHARHPEGTSTEATRSDPGPHPRTSSTCRT